MGRKPASQQGNTLETVRESAFKLFGRYGFDGVSMHTVAKASGVTKAALYWHYDGKDALYTDCMRELAALFERHVFAGMRGETDPMQRLLALFRGIGSLLADRHVQEGVAGYWLQPASASLADARAVQSEFEQSSAAYLTQCLQEAVDAGAMNFVIPVEDMANAVVSTTEAIILPLRRNSPEASRRLIGVLAHTFFRAHAHSDEVAAQAVEVAMEAAESAQAA